VPGFFHIFLDLCRNILDLPPTKNAWKKMVIKAVNEYWIEHIKKMSTYFKSLDYLNASNYSNGKAHAALASVQTKCISSITFNTGMTFLY
jgi:hypothetical protein